MGFNYKLEISKEGTMNSLIKHLQDKVITTLLFMIF